MIKKLVLNVVCLGVLSSAMIACSVPSKKEYDPAQPMAEQDNRKMIELIGESAEPSKIPKDRLGFFEESIEQTDKNGKKATVYHYVISLQIRCTHGKMIEAPLRGKLVKWNWEGVEEGREISDTNGFIIIDRIFPEPKPQRGLHWEVNKIKGTSDLSKGPYTLVLTGKTCYQR